MDNFLLNLWLLKHKFKLKCSFSIPRTFYFQRRTWETSGYFWSIAKVINFQVSEEWKAKQKCSFGKWGDCFHLPREPQGLLVMMQLTGDFQAWKCLGIFTNSKRQCLECNKPERYNQSKQVFTELADVYRFTGGRIAKPGFSFWTVAFCRCAGVHSIDPQSVAVGSRNHTRVLEMGFKHGLCVNQRWALKIRVGEKGRW